MKQRKMVELQKVGQLSTQCASKQLFRFLEPDIFISHTDSFMEYYHHSSSQNFMWLQRYLLLICIWEELRLNIGLNANCI
jgi:hypothetical protein